MNLPLETMMQTVEQGNLSQGTTVPHKSPVEKVLLVN